MFFFSFSFFLRSRCPRDQVASPNILPAACAWGHQCSGATRATPIMLEREGKGAGPGTSMRFTSLIYFPACSISGCTQGLLLAVLTAHAWFCSGNEKWYRYCTQAERVQGKGMTLYTLYIASSAPSPRTNLLLPKHYSKSSMSQKSMPQ